MFEGFPDEGPPSEAILQATSALVGGINDRLDVLDQKVSGKKTDQKIYLITHLKVIGGMMCTKLGACTQHGLIYHKFPPVDNSNAT